MYFIDKTDFRDLEYIVKYSNEIICCEGAVSHVSNGFNVKTYALIENFIQLNFGQVTWKNKTFKKNFNRKNLQEINLI